MPEYTMPMLGVMRETFERDGGSMRGDEDFFSVARTTPFVAIVVEDVSESVDEEVAGGILTFDSQCSNSLIYGVQGILLDKVSNIQTERAQVAQSYRSEQACRCKEEC
jgi:hypothetical protein